MPLEYQIRKRTYVDWLLTPMTYSGYICLFEEVGSSVTVRIQVQINKFSNVIEVICDINAIHNKRLLLNELFAMLIENVMSSVEH